MKVLVFCTANLGLGSGSEIRARLVVEGLRHVGVDVFVVASGVPALFSEVNVGSALLEPGQRWERLLGEAVRAFDPDILYGITEAGTDVVARVARRAGIPYAFDLHGLGVVEIVELGAAHPHRLLRMVNSLRWLARVPRADVVTVANPTLVPVVRRMNRRAVGVIGMTDVAHFTPEGDRACLGRDPAALQLLYAGNWFSWQGVDLLLEAARRVFSRTASWELTLVGSVGRRGEGEVDRLLAGLPRDRVHLVESVDYAVVPRYYRAADVLLLPRPDMWSTHLAFPQKLVDYMASGRSIVATSLDPHRWALEKPAAGVLCPPTAEGFAEGMLEAIAQAGSSQLGTNARRIAVERFCHLAQCRRIAKLFADTLSGRAGERPHVGAMS